MMEKKTLAPIYYKTMFARKNQLKEKLLLLFLGLAPFFRMVPEVFLRRRMGRRYFIFSIAIFIGFVLAIAPMVFLSVNSHTPEWGELISANMAYYAFLAVYFFQCFMRRRDIKRIKSVFDFQEYTKSSGQIHSLFLTIKDAEGIPKIRLIEIVIEPLAIFAVGMLCLLFSKGLGLFLIFCAIVYSLSYSAQYYLGDSILMDAIDKTIIGQEMESIMIEGQSPNGNRGVRFYGTRPSSPELRQRLWETMTRRKKGDSDEDEEDDGGIAI